jgi:predicted nucleotide-binding protein
MASYTYEQLKNMTVAQLRKIADEIEHEALKGHSTMHKDHLLPALCKALNIQVHHAAAGTEKAEIRATIRKLKSKRDEALAAGDHARLADVRHQIHVLKHKLRRMVAKSA